MLLVKYIFYKRRSNLQTWFTLWRDLKARRLGPLLWFGRNALRDEVYPTADGAGRDSSQRPKGL